MHSSSSSPPMQSKRPPNLSVQIAKRPTTRTVIELQTPVDDVDEEQDGYHSSSSSSSSASQHSDSDLNMRNGHDFNSDDLSQDLAVLEQLRRSVHKNLRLRPLRSVSGPIRAPPTQRPPPSSQPSDLPLNVVTDFPQQRSASPDSAFSPASAYYTPLTEFRATPLSAFHSRFPSVDLATHTAQPQPAPSTSTATKHGNGIDPTLLLARLSSPTRPLLIDTRPVQAFVASHLRGSVNMTIPSLILKRLRRPAGAIHTLDALRQYITTEDGKQQWDTLITGADWDGDVIVFDETMNEKDRSPSQAAAWSIIEVVNPLLDHGYADFLEGGFAAARRHPYLSEMLLSNTDAENRVKGYHVEEQTTPPPAPRPNNKKPAGGLFQLDTLTALRSKALPEIEQPAPSPQPVMPAAIQSWTPADDYSSPSPAPSATVFSRPQPPRRPSIPTLRRIDTDRPSVTLQKLQVRAPPRSHTLAAPPVNDAGHTVRYRSRSPSHLNLSQSNYSPPGTARLLSAGPITPSHDMLLPPSPNMGQCLSPRSPRTPQPFSPPTPRPDFDQPPTTEEPFPEFTISTILPNFLYLGPELTAEEHVESLLSLGVKRIVNIAAECDDDHGLHLRERFDRYVHIPMRDTVEEDNITRGVRDVCTILGKPCSFGPYKPGSNVI
ncbi:hypothetical protein EIP86_006279 [Pleurotus ostreatoroseus]|nr:hypothetical protein EIP86_006279 [Pleurotus ostreatoroseus]